MIADDHPIFRDGLRRLLEAEPDLKVIGEACDGSEAVKMARQLRPDIMLLDLAMPRTPGLEALRELSTGPVSNAVRVILLTAAAEKKQIVEALQLGARGVVLKDSATQLLLKSIHTVCRANIGLDARAFPTWCSICVIWRSPPAKKPSRRNSASLLVNSRLFPPWSRDTEQGNRRIFQDQRGYGQAPPEQYLR